MIGNHKKVCKDLNEVPHGIGTNYNFEPYRKREFSKFLYINRAPLNEESIIG